MFPSIAQVVPDPKVLSSWLEVLFYLGGFVATVLGGAVAWKSLQEKPVVTPQPLEVKKHDGGVSEDELRNTHGRITRERGEVNNEIARVEEQLGSKVDTLESKIDSNTAMTSEIRGKVELMNQQLSQILTQLLRR